MRIAGVHVGGRTAWVDAGDYAPRCLDVVDVMIAGIRSTGTVLVNPEQLVGDPPVAEGKLLQPRERVGGTNDCMELPGADMPPLGSETDDGVVVGIDAVKRTVSIERENGTKDTRSL